MCLDFAKCHTYDYGLHLSEGVLFVLMQLCQSKMCCYVLFREKRISPLKQAVRVESSFNCHEL